MKSTLTVLLTPILAVFLSAFLPGSTTALAASHDADNFRTLTLYLENDYFAGTDKNYSNAVKLTWISEDLTEYGAGARSPGWAVPLFKAVPFGNRPGYQHNIAVSLGQNIYTPDNTDAETLVADDRPYAGLTYAALALHNKNRVHLDTMELTLGIVGPSSLAEDTQKAFHDLIGSDKPQGWDHQLKDEFVAALTWQHNWRALVRAPADGFGFDLIPHVGATAGNIAVFVNAGAEYRVGYNLPDDFGDSLIRPGGNVAAPAADTDLRLGGRSDFGIYVFVRGEGRAVARNLFLDGNTWEDSHSVDKEPLVGDLSAGLSVVYDRFKLTYTHVYRTEAFEEQDGGQTFGSVSLSYTY